MHRLTATLDPASPLTVGCVGDAAHLEHLVGTDLKAECDIVEIRLDALRAPVAELRAAWQQCMLPLLFTARRVDEGGQGVYDTATRQAMLQAVLDDAGFIDVELASADEMAELITIAQLRGIPVILSAHDFEGTPNEGQMRETIRRGRDLGASVVKIATWLQTPQDLARLATLLTEDHGLPLSLMGMGPMAAASRLLLAQLGSVLNYGYLGTVATAPGQWSAQRLKEAIESVEMIPRQA
jgi:3-dehydroquinate dehydratase-1